MARPKKTLYYRAKESFVATVGHDHVQVTAGELAAADYKHRPGGDELWEPATESDYVRFFKDDETATDAPGEQRLEAPVHDAGVEDFDEMTLAELKELARDRGVTPGTMSKSDLIDAIRLRGQ